MSINRKGQAGLRQGNIARKKLHQQSTNWTLLMEFSYPSTLFAKMPVENVKMQVTEWRRECIFAHELTLDLSFIYIYL
jgi:hypothetical protein